MPFEDELGEALRRAGDGFTADRHALAAAGEERGRRLVARRRAAVVGGSVLALAVIGTAGAYSGGLLGGSGAADVAAPAPLQSGRSGKGTGADGNFTGGGSGAVTGDQLIAVLKELLPAGQLTGTKAVGTDKPPMVSGVFDDGKGKAALSLALARIDPNGSHARARTECGDKNIQEYDSCTVEQLADGSKVLLHQGYEYPDRRVDTKVWWASLVTPQGFHVTLSEWNAAGEKGAGISRPNPPLTTAQLKAIVTSDKWLAALNDLPAAEPEQPRDGSSVSLVDEKAGPALERLVTKHGIPVVSKGEDGGSGYVVLDDGKGKSLVQLSITKGEEAARDFTGGDAAPLEDGTQVKVTQRPAQKGKGVVEWSVDTLHKNGLRVVVLAYNTANVSGSATREAPALTLEQLKELVLAPGWNRASGS
uniref:LigA protein n=1 Tax=Streptomyces sp. NBC_00049 TaxID=2903617 RepID=A0AAU2JQY9_9ACTN